MVGGNEIEEQNSFVSGQPLKIELRNPLLYGKSTKYPLFSFTIITRCFTFIEREAVLFNNLDSSNWKITLDLQY